MTPAARGQLTGAIRERSYVGAIVVLEGGHIWSWKTNRGEDGAVMGRNLSSRYFLAGSPGRNTRIETARFDDPGAFDKAQEWRRQWPRHPAATGFDPHK